tara:strand:+ start:22 stop:561 length:540 start_codon:yes stop_codon:yes gene_type:complete
MTKLCPRGKAAAKRKFKVYPSAYANAYASKICAGKIKDPSGVKRKDFKGPKPAKEGTLASTKNPKRAIEKEALVRKRKKQRVLGADVKKEKLPKVIPQQVGFKELLKQTVSPVAHIARPIINYKRRKEAEKENKARGYEQGGFNNVGGHSVMGSPISVDVDGDNLINVSASDYYKDLLK